MSYFFGVICDLRIQLKYVNHMLSTHDVSEVLSHPIMGSTDWQGKSLKVKQIWAHSQDPSVLWHELFTPHRLFVPSRQHFLAPTSLGGRQLLRGTTVQQTTSIATGGRRVITCTPTLIYYWVVLDWHLVYPSLLTHGCMKCLGTARDCVAVFAVSPFHQSRQTTAVCTCKRRWAWTTQKESRSPSIYPTWGKGEKKPLIWT